MFAVKRMLSRCNSEMVWPAIIAGCSVIGGIGCASESNHFNRTFTSTVQDAATGVGIGFAVGVFSPVLFPLAITSVGIGASVRGVSKINQYWINGGRNLPPKSG